MGRGTRAPSTARVTGRTAVRGACALAATGALVATMVAAQGPAAAEGKVLQSVSVQLGTDGTITGLTSKALTVTDGGDASTSTQVLSPAALGDRLPIRVQTSYQYGDQQGTDLADLAGKSGTFTINVTVTNTTVAPTTVQYDAGGTSHTSYALIGTPMTVLANADLHSNNLSQVVTDGGDQVARNTAWTNGVIGTGSDGNTSVQWSAMLAPPRLSPTTTFTLVESSSKFVVPTFNISAQPGLVTDASMNGLLNSAFSDDAGSARSLQESTINTIADVDTALDGVLAGLARIRSQLSGSAADLGTRTISHLQANTGQLASQLTAISSELASRSADLTGNVKQGAPSSASTLGTADRTVAGALDRELATIRSQVLGRPEKKAPSISRVNGCDVPNLAGLTGATPTAYQLVGMVQGWLGTLADSATACKAQVASQIATAIGDTSKPCASPTALLCSLTTVQSDVADNLTALTTLNGAQQQTLPDLAEHVLAAKGDFTLLRSAYASLTQDAGTQSDSLDTVGDDLSGLSDDLAALQSDVGDVDLDAIGSKLDDMHATAGTQIDALTSLPDPLPHLTALVGATDGCSGDMSSISTLQGLLDFVGDPADCVPGPATTALRQTIADVQQYVAAVSTSLAAWHTVADATDPAQQSSLAHLVSTAQDELGQLGTSVGTAQHDLATARTDLKHATTAGGTLGDLLSTLAALLGDTGDGSGSGQNPGATLFDPTAPGAGSNPSSPSKQDCSDAQAPTTDLPLGNALLIDATALTCGGTTLAAAIQAADDAQTGAGDAIARSGAVTSTVQGQLSQLFDGFAGSATTSRARAGAAATTTIGRTSTLITAANEAAKNDIAGRFATAATSITGAFGQAAGNLGTTNASLSKDFQDLLIDLDGGDAAHGAGGVVGVLNQNAARTGSQADRLALQAAASSAFNAVQGVNLQALDRQKAEMSQALDAAANAKPFGIDLPTQSVLTVYAFTIGGSR